MIPSSDSWFAVKEDSKEMEFVREPPASFQFVVELKSSLCLLASMALSRFVLGKSLGLY